MLGWLREALRDPGDPGEWLGQLLQSVLGRALLVQPEHLRVGLFSGLQLRDVALNPALFHDAAGPLRVVEGRVGRLQVKVPWRALLAQPIVLEVAGVAERWPG